MDWSTLVWLTVGGLVLGVLLQLSGAAGRQARAAGDPSAAAPGRRSWWRALGRGTRFTCPSCGAANPIPLEQLGSGTVTARCARCDRLARVKPPSLMRPDPAPERGRARLPRRRRGREASLR